MGDTKAFKNFINGRWVESKSGKTFENRNPADTSDLIGVFQKSTAEDVTSTVEEGTMSSMVTWKRHSYRATVISMYTWLPME